MPFRFYRDFSNAFRDPQTHALKLLNSLLWLKQFQSNNRFYITVLEESEVGETLRASEPWGEFFP